MINIERMKTRISLSSSAVLSLPIILGMVGCAQIAQPPAPIVSGQTAPIISSPSVPTPAKVISEPEYTPAETLPLDQPTIRSAPAPSVRPTSILPIPRSGMYTVQPGDNLFRISINHGLKYQEVASWNQLDQNYDIKVGQVIRLTPPNGSGSTEIESNKNTTVENKQYPKGVAEPYHGQSAKEIEAKSEGSNTKHKTETPTETKPKPAESTSRTSPEKPSEADTVSTAKQGEWIWPANGKVIEKYSDNNKGIDIAGNMGEPILAAKDGKIVYSGNGLRGYGKLIIIKHDKVFLSAYAHNSKLLVKEGQSVKQGQKIAEMGNSDTNRVKLHFEIRQYGKPIDPSQYLKK